MTISILIVDDHIVFREGVRMLLESNDDFKVVGEASNGKEALALTALLHPEVIVLDMVMPGMNGIEVLKQLHKLGLNSRVVILSLYTDETYKKAAFQNYAYSYVSKDDIVAQLATAVRWAAEGRIFLGPPDSAK